jgi:hypothetical protein
MGFPDGRIIGYDVPRINAARTGWFDGIKVRESLDGGSTWREIGTLLEGCAPYLWRARRLKDGTLLLLTCLYGTPWGLGKERTTRNTMLPGETYINKIQTCFLASRDGVHFTGPHYVLPGIGAHEYDVCECPDGRLLFIAGDVQATPVGRQFVERKGDSYLNGTFFGIRRGAPQEPKRDPMGGFVPESLIMRADGLIIGSRRNKPYSCSTDFGENWYEVEGLPTSLYQPFLFKAADGNHPELWSQGRRHGAGSEDMVIGVDRFRVENRMPQNCTADARARDGRGTVALYQRISAPVDRGWQAGRGARCCFARIPSGMRTAATARFHRARRAYSRRPRGRKRRCAHPLPMFDGRPDIPFLLQYRLVYSGQSRARVIRPAMGP